MKKHLMALVLLLCVCLCWAGAAQAEETYCTLTLDPGEGSWDETTLTGWTLNEEDNTISKQLGYGTEFGADDLPKPTWEKHRFDCWYIKDSWGSFPSTVTLTEDTTIWAEWTELFDVTLSASSFGNIFKTDNGGRPDTKRITVEFGEDITQDDLKSWMKESFHFEGISHGYRLGDEIFGDTTMMVEWSCTVSFYANGGTGALPEPIKVRSGDGNTSPVIPYPDGLEKKGHSFTEWNTDKDGNGSPCTGGSYFYISDLGDTTLYAIWQPNKYTLTLDANGGTWASTLPEGWTKSEDGNTVSKQLDYGTEISEADLPVPTREDFEVEKWQYQTSESATDITFSYTMEGDTTFHAVWAPVATVKIENNPESDRGTIWMTLENDDTKYTTITAPVGTKVYLHAQADDRYVFEAWKGLYVSISKETDGTWSFVIPSQGTTITASFQPNFCTVTLDANGGNFDASVTAAGWQTSESGTICKEFDFGADGKVTINQGDLPTPTRATYAFDFWQQDNWIFQYGTSVSDQSITLKAEWEQLYQLFISKENYGGTVEFYKDPSFTEPCETDAQGKIWGRNGEAIYAKITLDPHMQVEYFRGGVWPYLGDAGTACITFARGRTTTVIFAFEYASYAITLDANGGSFVDDLYDPNCWTLEDEKLTGNLTYGDTVLGYVPEEDGVIREHYTLAGWYTAADETGEEVTWDTTVTGPATYYAHWTPVKYKLTLDPGENGKYDTTPDGWTLGADGKLFKEFTYTEQTPETLPAPDANEGYEFDGWDGTLPGTLTADTTLTAKYAQLCKIVAYVNGDDAETCSVAIYTDEEHTKPLPADAPYVGAGTTVYLQLTAGTHCHLSGWESVGEAGTLITQPGRGPKCEYTVLEDDLGNTIMITANVIYNYYQVTFDANGGVFSIYDCGSWTLNNDSTGLSLGLEYNSHVLRQLPTEVIDEETPTRTHYDFGGWYTAATGGDPVDENTQVTGVTTYYAHWTPKKYTITFNANGGVFADGINATPRLAYNTAVLNGAPASPMKDNYDFDGWYTAADGGDKVTETTMVPGETTYYAHWKLKQYTLTLNPDGGAWASDKLTGGWTQNADGTISKKFDHGASVSLNDLPAPEKEHNVYQTNPVPWKNGENTAKFPLTMTSDVTLTVQWIKQYNIKVEVVPDADGETHGEVGFYYDSDYENRFFPGEDGAWTEYGHTIMLEADPEDGYEIDKWECTDARSYAFHLDSQNPARAEACPQGKDMVVKVYFKLKECEFTFDANGGCFDNNYYVTTKTATQTAFRPVPAVPSTDPARHGCEFAGWYTEKTGGDPYDPTETAIDHVTYYAHWTPLYYMTATAKDSEHGTAKLYLTADYSDTPVSSDTGIWVKAGTTVYIKPEPNEGYQVDQSQWSCTGRANLSSDAATGTATCTPYDGDFNEELGDLYYVEIQCGFKIKEHTITFDATDGAFGEGLTLPEGWKLTEDRKQLKVTIQHGASVKETLESATGYKDPTRTHYSFNEWNAAQDGSGTWLSTNAIKATGDTTYYAQWEVVKYELKLEPNGGSFGADLPTNWQKKEDGSIYQYLSYNTSSPASLPEPTRSGYKFDGWYTTAEGGYEYASKPMDVNSTYYAHWKKIHEVRLTSQGGMYMKSDKGAATGSVFLTVVDGDCISKEDVASLLLDNRSLICCYYDGSKVEYDFATPVTSGMTLWVQWCYTVTFDANGGTGSVSNLTIETVNLEELPEPGNLEKAGLAFAGWNTKQDGTGTTYQPGDYFSNPEVGNTTLYAMWDTGYSVTVENDEQLPQSSVGGVTLYSDENCTKTLGSSAQLLAGKRVYLKAEDMEHYNFSRWEGANALSDNPKIAYLDMGTKDVNVRISLLQNENGRARSALRGAQDQDVTAYYTPKKYTLTLNPGGHGSFASTPAGWTTNADGSISKQFVYDTEITETLPTPDSEDPAFAFDKWNSAAPSKLTADTTLTAQWTQLYRISISADPTEGGDPVLRKQGESDGDPAVWVPEGTVLEIVPKTADNYRYDGWKLKEEQEVSPLSRGSSLQTGNYTVGNENAQLEACYTKLITVTFDAGEGVFADRTGLSDDKHKLTCSIGEGETVAKPAPAPTRAGYELDGWTYKSGDTLEERDFSFETPLFESVTVTAKWVKVYTITVQADPSEGGTLKLYKNYNSESETLSNPYSSNTVKVREGTVLYLAYYGNEPAAGVRYEWTEYAYESDKVDFGNFRDYYDDDSEHYITVCKITAKAVDASITVKFKKQFAVTFYANGGEFEPGKTTYTRWKDEDSKITSSGLPCDGMSRSGYTSAGWMTSNGTGFEDFTVPEEGYTVTAPLDLYAKWSYQVTFDKGTVSSGSIDGTMAPQTFYAGTPAALKECAFTSEDYAFAGWKVQGDTTGKVYADGEQFSSSAGNVTLVAQWTPKLIVTLDANGGRFGTGESASETSKVKVAPGSTVSTASPDKPTRENFTLYGWKTEDDKEFDLSKDAVNSSITLKAVWSYTVTFDRNGGDAEVPQMDPLVIVDDGKENLPKCTYTKEGSAFNGWKMEGDTSGRTYRDEWKDFSYDKGNVTLVAQWATLYTIEVSSANDSYGTAAIYDLDDTGYEHPSAKVTVPENTPLNLKATVKEGYKFHYWRVEGRGSFGSDDATYGPYYVEGNASIQAVFGPKQYFLFLKPNGGQFPYEMNPNETAGKNVYYGEKIDETLAEVYIFREGYDLAGWQTEDGKTFDAENTTITGNLTLVAQWTPRKYTVTFHANGGLLDNGKETKEVQVNWGEAIPTADVPTLSRTGYTADEDWFTAGEGGTAFDMSSLIKADTTIYAHWTLTPYTVTVTTDGGGTASASKTTAHMGDTITLTAEPDEGKLLKEWQVEAGGVTVGGDGTFTMGAGNVTIKAVFDDKLTITFDPNGGKLTGNGSQFIVKGGKATEPAEPTWDGEHSFLGWFLPAADTPFSFDTPLTESTTLTARWATETHSITLQTQGDGTAASNPKDKTAAGIVVELTATPGTGYQFDRWEVISGGVTVENNKFTMGAQDVTIKAHFKPVELTVTFDAAGGTPADPVKVLYGDKLSALPGTEKEGFTFDGWFEKDAETAFDLDKAITESLTLYAHWTENPTPTPEPTATVSGEPEPTTTVSGEPEPTTTVSGEPEPTATVSGEPEPTATVSSEPEPTATVSSEPEPTATVSSEPEPTATVSGEPEPTATVSGEPEPTATVSSEPEPTATVSGEPEPTATATQLPEPTATAAPTATAVPTVTPVPTATALPTATPAAAPITIVRQPVDTRGMEGQQAVFTVEARGDGLVYQWFVNRNDGAGFVPCAGSNGPTHTTTALKRENNGYQYYCQITCKDGTIRTATVTLTVENSLPQTGDATNLTLWLALVAMSYGGMLMLLHRARRNRLE